MRYIVSLLILSFSISCRPCKPIINHFVVLDTVIQKEVKKDTVFSFSELIDTVNIEKERLKIQIVKYNNTISVHGRCLGDTIYRNHTVTVLQPVKVVKINKGGFLKWWYLLFVGAIIGIVFIKLH